MRGSPEERIPAEFEEYPFRPEVSSRKSGSSLWVHAVLFIATIITTTIAGALFEGVDFKEGVSVLWRGLPFSCTLLVILLSHEMGHYLASRGHRVKATLPYFIPAPFIGVGTFGAFIKIKEPIRDRRSLLDIGVAGPLSGAVLSIIAVVWGLGHSQVLFTPLEKETMTLGEPLLFKMLSILTIGKLPENANVILHPVAFAGWLGLFITALNLIPVGQLDGGHIVFALTGPWHLFISRFAFLALVIIGVWGGLPYPSWMFYLFGVLMTFYAILNIASSSTARKLGYLVLTILWISTLAQQHYDTGTGVWLFWSVLVNFLRFDHPPVYDLYRPLEWWRKLLGVCAILLFVLTFVPKPFKIIY